MVRRQRVRLGGRYEAPLREDAVDDGISRRQRDTMRDAAATREATDERVLR